MTFPVASSEYSSVLINEAKSFESHFFPFSGCFKLQQVFLSIFAMPKLNEMPSCVWLIRYWLRKQLNRCVTFSGLLVYTLKLKIWTDGKESLYPCNGMNSEMRCTERKTFLLKVQCNYFPIIFPQFVLYQQIFHHLIILLLLLRNYQLWDTA